MSYTPTVWVDDSAPFIDAANLNKLENGLQAVAAVTDAVWTTYTPVWTSSGTQPSIGNGTLTGRYVQVGKLVFFSFRLVAGSTTTFGTGTYSFSLPVTGSSSFAVNTPIGHTYMLDSSAGSVASALVIYATTTTFNVQYPATWPSGVQTTVAQTAPWTWATSDFILASGAYEAA